MWWSLRAKQDEEHSEIEDVCCLRWLGRLLRRCSAEATAGHALSILLLLLLLAEDVEGVHSLRLVCLHAHAHASHRWLLLAWHHGLEATHHGLET